VDLIKVDRCFLDGLVTDHRDAALMRGILAIGSGMDLGVIAEAEDRPGRPWRPGSWPPLSSSARALASPAGPAHGRCRHARAKFAAC
jgi:hypothetical protein